MLSSNLVIFSLKAGILAVGRGNQVVVPVTGDDGSKSTFSFTNYLDNLWDRFLTLVCLFSGTDKPAVVTKMNLTLSADHRVFDGKVGGK